ncbi:hypothetical protein D3C73_1463680 [compost metagenome]
MLARASRFNRGIQSQNVDLLGYFHNDAHYAGDGFRPFVQYGNGIPGLNGRLLHLFHLLDGGLGKLIA